MIDTAYGIVPMSIEDWTSGKLPHVQPGVSIRFEEWMSDAERSIHEYDAPFDMKPQLSVLFEVPQNVLNQTATESHEHGVIGKSWQSTLPMQHVKQCVFLLSCDALNELDCRFYQSVAEGEKPNYEQAQRMLAKRVHSFDVLEKVLANTEPTYATQVRHALSQNRMFPGECEKALRDILGSEDFPSSMVFRAGGTHFERLMYTDPIGMDAAMRVIQCTLHNMVPQLDVPSLMKLNDAYFKELQAQASMAKDQSPKNILSCVGKALESFKATLDPKFHDVINQTQQSLPHYIALAKQEMAKPEAQCMRNAMEFACDYFVAHEHNTYYFVAHEPPIRGEVQIYNTYLSALGRTTEKDFSARMLQAASKTLDEVERSQYHFGSLAYEYLSGRNFLPPERELKIYEHSMLSIDSIEAQRHATGVAVVNAFWEEFSKHASTQAAGKFADFTEKFSAAYKNQPADVALDTACKWLSSQCTYLDRMAITKAMQSESVQNAFNGMSKTNLGEIDTEEVGEDNP